MSESLLINVLIGLFTILGVLVGSILEFLRERWKIKNEIVKTFLSPLSYKLETLTFKLKFFRVAPPTEARWRANEIIEEISYIRKILEPNIRNLPRQL
ncbi:hypothetical protein KEJ18_06405 [Candidatus Bathyarchaeota archaeon]|nr:hypothetical protein [Candidatus Bathyarchaeota archaeon]